MERCRTQAWCGPGRSQLEWGGGAGSGGWRENGVGYEMVMPASL